MSKPEIEIVGGLYRFTWPESEIVIELDRLRESRDGLRAELTVMTTRPGVPSHLLDRHINLMSETSHLSLEKRLNNRWNGINWGDMLEQACVMAKREHRKGEPLSLVGSLPPRERPKHRVYPLLLESEANMIFGPGGSGKSKFACLLSLLVQSGKPYCGLRPIQGNVLYLDYETCREECDETLKMLKAGMGFEEDINISYRYCSQPLWADVPELLKKVAECEADMLVIDSVGSACGGEPESAEIVLNYFMALRSLKVTTLSIDHVAHKGEGRPFGSVYKINNARSVWELKKIQEPGESTLKIDLHHRKINAGKLQKPLGFQFEFSEDEDIIFVSPFDVAADAETSVHLPLGQRILYVLRHGWMPVKDIAEELGEKEDRVRTRLHELKGKRQVTQEGSNWGLMSHEQ